MFPRSSNAVRLIRAWLPMVLPAMVAAYGLDLVLGGPWGHWGWWGFLLGFGGLLGGGFLALGHTYRLDHAQGRVRRRLVKLEGCLPPDDPHGQQ